MENRYYDVFDYQWEWLAQFKSVGHATSFCHVMGLDPKEQIQENFNKSIKEKCGMCEHCKTA